MVVRSSMEGSAGTGVCLALGAGTFLHVSAMEVLCQREKTGRTGVARDWLDFVARVAFVCTGG